MTAALWARSSTSCHRAPNAREQSSETGSKTWRMQVEKGLVKMRDRGELSRDASPADIALAVLTALQGGLLLSKGEKSKRPLEVAFEMALAYVAAHDPRAAGERKPIRTG